MKVSKRCECDLRKMTVQFSGYRCGEKWARWQEVVKAMPPSHFCSWES